jgi:hypothetical protein
VRSLIVQEQATHERGARRMLASVSPGWPR